MSGFKHYKRKGLSEMRPYVPGESMDGVSVSDADKALPTLEGGFIARNPVNHDDKWYVSKEYHAANLEESLEIAENAVEETKVFGLTFGQAINALKEGKMVSRSGWNGKNLFVFMQVPSVINKDIVPRMQSLPQSVKDEFEKRFNDPKEQIDSIYYDNQLAIVNQSNLINGWAPSVSDALSHDWQIVE